MEQFRQIGEVLGSLRALMVLRDDIQINQRQCCLLFDMFNLAFDTISEEIKQNLKLEERNTKWKPLEQPLKELHRVFKEGESYLRLCLDPKDWWVKAVKFHSNRDCVELHIHNLLSCFSIVIEAIEIAGEISGLDLDDMKKKRIMLDNKYDKKWNDPKLFQWKYGKQYLVSKEICQQVYRAWKEDQWLLLETIQEKKNSKLTSQEQRLGQSLLKKLNGQCVLFPASILTGSKDYLVRRRIGGGSQYKEIQWMGESFALRHFFGDSASLNTEISAMSSLSHPNIIQYLCGFHDEEKKDFFLVMELMSKDLSSYIKEVCGPKRRLPFSLPVAVDIMLQIARGMEYLHSQNIYHGDLNPSNVLIKPRNTSLEGYFHAKVSGFGLASVQSFPTRSTSPDNDETLAFIWHAPEVLTEQEKPGSRCKVKYSEKADVYSFGMLCFELLTGKVPFEDGHLQGDKMSRNIRAGVRPLFPFALPKYLATLTKRCWQTDPNQRPSFASICRILRYVKRLIVMNPHPDHPEIPSTQVDVCDIEAAFVKRFHAEGSVNLTAVSQIPVQLFAYRLEEKEKLTENDKDKNWETHSERVPSLCNENVNVADEVFLHARDTRSVCSEIPEKKVTFSIKAQSITEDEEFMSVNDSKSICSEVSHKKKPPLKKSNSIVAVDPSLMVYDTRSMRPEIPDKKVLPPKKPISDTRSVCSEIPEKRVPEKKALPLTLRRSNSVTSGKEPGKQKTPTKKPSLLNPRGRSMRIVAERQPSMLDRRCRCRRKSAGHLTDSEIH